VEDIKRALFMNQRDAEFYPRYVFLGIPPDPTKEPTASTRYQAADYTFIDKSGTTFQTINLLSPLTTLRVTDKRFVDPAGNFKTTSVSNWREKTCLEKLFPTQRSLLFHVFTLNQVLGSFSGPRPLSNMDWNGRFAMYFPDVPFNGPYEATEEDVEEGEKIITYFNIRNQRIEDLEALLGIPMPDVKVKGIQRLRLTWNPVPNGEGPEMLFYRLPVIHRRPFMRLLPELGQPVNKIHTLADVYPPRPDIEDPNFLRQWASESAPKEDSDYLMMKMLIRELRSGQKPLYATHRVFADTSSDLVVLPLKQERYLDVDIDLGDFSTQLTEALDGTLYTLENMSLGDISATYQIDIDPEQPKLTRKELERRLPCFAPFLQLTPVYTTEIPQMMLRYKAVSQFTVQNTIITFIHFLTQKGLIKGGEPPAAWIEKVAEEFQLSLKDSHDIIVEYLENKGQFVIVNPTQEDLMEGKNPGIDIAIFENHPTYSIHVFGADSEKHIPRILMLLRMLISLPADQLECSARSAAAVTAAEAALATDRYPPQLSASVVARGGAGQKPLAQPTSGTAASASAASAAFDDFNYGANADVDGMGGGIDFSLFEGAAEADEGLGDAPDEGPGAAGAGMGEEEEAEAAVAVANNSNTEITKEQLEKGMKSKDAPVIHNFIINLLKKADPELFNYQPGKTGSPYSRKCQATMDAQPIVMTRQQFEKNYKLYQDKIIVFPIRGSSAPPPVVDKTQEVFMFTRYGTNPKLDLFYTCPPIFCVRDFLIIARDEFKSTRARDGTAKAPFTCPFCKGTIIQSEKKGELNATVIVRKAKGKAALRFDGRDETFRYIGFMKSGDHPGGFNLPCCYLKPPVSKKQFTLTADNEIFSKQTEWLRKGLLRRMEDEEAEYEEEEEQLNQPATEEEAAALAEEAAATASVSGTYVQSEFQLTTRPRAFMLTLNNLHNEYIQSYEKLLAHGKFALLSPALNAYFEQDSADMVKTIASRQMLVPTAKGLLRVGVGNTPRNRPDSLLAALAPLMGLTVIAEVKQRIMDAISPRVFIHANYGNLVNEYFNPNDPEPRGTEMEEFAAKHLRIDNNSENRMAISRFYRSYHRFLADLENPLTTKQLRVFSELLQVPGLLLNNGRSLLLVVLEADFNDPMRPIRVLCPAYGISPYARDNADIAFIVRFTSRDQETGDVLVAPFYEPLLWTQNYPATTTRGEIHQHWFVFQRANESSWPLTIKGRIKAFLSQCEGPGRMPYASQTGPDPYAMISISQLYEFLGKGMPEMMGKTKKPNGILRDSYNHVAALLYAVAGKERYITVPVVDDGYIYPDIPNVELDWEGYEPATVDEIESFYKSYVKFRFSALYPGYFPKYQVKAAAEDRVVAIQLANGLFIPAAPPKKPTDLPVSPARGVEFEWRINKKLVEVNEVPFEAPEAIDIKYVNELYEHFRLSFSNWVVSQGSEAIKQQINEIVTNEALPLNDKRKRLDILLYSTIERWLDVDADREVTDFEIIRKDCITIDSKDQCSGTCRWVEDGGAAAAEGQGRCRIHVPAEAGNKRINTVLLFTQRLYDELIRIPFKREELMKQGVEKLKIPTDAVLVGDQWILPEMSSQWIDLKRLEWAMEKYDKPRFYEEMSREPSDEPAPFLRRPSDELIAFLGAGADKLYVWTPPTNDTSIREPYISFAPILNFAFSDTKIGLPRSSPIMTQEAATEGAKRASKILVFANISRNSIIVGRPLPSQPVKGYIVFVEQEGVLPSLLVSGPKSPALVFDAVPEVLRGAIKRSAPVFGRPGAAAAAAAVPEGPGAGAPKRPAPTFVSKPPAATALPSPPPPEVDAEANVLPAAPVSMAAAAAPRRTIAFRTKAATVAPQPEAAAAAAAEAAPRTVGKGAADSEEALVRDEANIARQAAAVAAPPPVQRRKAPTFVTSAKPAPQTVAAPSTPFNEAEAEAAPAPAKNPFNDF
jgi:hypothetical protein